MSVEEFDLDDLALRNLFKVSSFMLFLQLCSVMSGGGLWGFRKGVAEAAQQPSTTFAQKNQKSNYREGSGSGISWLQLLLRCLICVLQFMATEIQISSRY